MSGTFQLILFVDRLHRLARVFFWAFPELACLGCDECGVTFGVSDRHLYTTRFSLLQRGSFQVRRIRCYEILILFRWREPRASAKFDSQLSEVYFLAIISQTQETWR